TRFVLVPFGFRECTEEFLDLRDERRRCNGASQNPQARALLLRRGVARASESCNAASPTADIAVTGNRLRTVRVVQRQDARLHRSVRCAEASRMLGIALDLSRPPQMALGERARRNTRDAHRRGVKHGLPGNSFL